MDNCKHENITFDNHGGSCDDCDREFRRFELSEMWAHRTQANGDLKGLLKAERLKNEELEKDLSEANYWRYHTSCKNADILPMKYDEWKADDGVLKESSEDE